MLKDTLKHQGLRNQLVKGLIRKGISDAKVLKAIAKIPRHLFMDSSFENFGYQDNAFPIAANQTISQPYTVAIQTQMLAVKPNQKILEIGTGSGYQTAILISLKAKVFTIERQQELYKKTSVFLPKLGFRPKAMRFGDGYLGLPDFAPFDGIIVTAGAPVIPKSLLEQLKIGGRLVIPVGEKTQVMTLIIRKAEKDFEKQFFGDFRFVPMLKKKS